jgi:hypothetical protein
MNIKRPARKKFIITDNRLRLAAIIATLMVAALAVGMRVETPVVWSFLLLVITTILGQRNDETQRS